MKKLLFLFLLLVTISFVYSDEQSAASGSNKETYNKFQDSVVYIEIDVFIESTDISNPALFSKIENLTGKKILDSYVSLGRSGSGFFITDDGYIVTNHHVIDIPNEKQMKENVVYDLQDILFDLNPNQFSYREFDSALDILKASLDRIDLVYRVTVKNKDVYTARLLFSDKTLDLALLKINSTNFSPIKLNKNVDINVGDEVMAIGYPLPTKLAEVVSQVKSTFTTGVISAIRNETWGIQHTSAINPGNSGGPLLNTDGVLMGINVGYNPGESIYFSIPVPKLMKWLKDNNKEECLTKNKEYFAKFKDEDDNEFAKEINTGSNILIDIADKSTIFVDDKEYGVTPIILKLQEGKHTITVENDKGYDVKMFNIDPKITDLYNYKPKLKKYKGNLSIKTTPNKAKVFIDDNEYGETPLNLPINTGDHNIAIKYDGYALLTEEIKLVKHSNIQKEYSLEKGYMVSFDKTLPIYSTITVENDKIKGKYRYDEKIYLNTGKYKIYVKDKILEDNNVFDIEVIDKDIVIYDNLNYIGAVVKLYKIDDKTRVFLDGDEITGNIKNNSFKAPLGFHTLLVKNKYTQYIYELNVEKNKEINIHYFFTDNLK